MVRNNHDLEGWGSDFLDEDEHLVRYTESFEIDNANEPNAVQEADKEADINLGLTAAGMALAILAGYGVKRALKKRKA